MADQQERTAFFTLSTEELALVFFLINCPEQGRDLMKRYYQDLDDEQLSAYLTAARNSLISKDLCTISDKNTLVVPEVLERAVFPLVSFDQVFGIYRVVGGEPWYWDVFVNGNKDMTFLVDQYGIVQNLTYTTRSSFANMVSGLFPWSGAESNGSKDLKLRKGTSLALVLNIIESPQDEAVKQLVEAGWSEEDSRLFLEDARSQSARGTISRQKADYKSYSASSEELPSRLLVLLFGPSRTWLLESNQDPADQLDQVAILPAGEIKQRITGFVK